MTYYRLAMQDRHTARWIWKSTALTSLQAVFELLRIFGAHPQSSTRVFTASSREGLNERLNRQNNNQESGSVTATQFLRERNLTVSEPAQSTSGRHVSAQAAQPEADVATWAKDVWEKHTAMRRDQAVQPAAAATTTPGMLSNLGMNLQEQKRLEIELGPGGDHDTPYLFTLPVSLKERLDWLRLQARLKAGELAS